MLKHVLDIVAIFLLGDGASKMLSPVNHSRFYQAAWAPPAYNRFLQKQVDHPSIPVLMGLAMLVGGALLTRWAEKQAS